MSTNPSAAWEAFCQQLAEAGKLVLDDKVPKDPLVQTEGYRYLSRLTKLALEQYVEAVDPDFPFFYQLSHETGKIGADNPDNLYLNTSIKGDCDYRITGKLGTMPYFSIVANAMRYHIDGSAHATGSLMMNEIDWGPNGEVEIIASCNPQPKNWLRLEPDASVIIIRQSYMDRSTERPGEFKIERINGPERPEPLATETFCEGLSRAGQFVQGVSKTFFDWACLFQQYPNQFPDIDQSMFQKAGGAADIYYAHAYWKIAEDEAWIIEVQPPACDYWNFQLDNFWMESFDYRFRDVTLNKHSAKLDEDGMLRIVCCKDNPGVANWMDTSGHPEGTALIRWVGATEHPLPTTRIVKLNEL